MVFLSEGEDLADDDPNAPDCLGCNDPMDPTSPTGDRASDVVDATRRTQLATERTELAWWRTGLTALAVALGVGRVVPGLDDSSTRWPYVVAGVCFALYGVAVVAYGSLRRSSVERALSEGRFPQHSSAVHTALALAGIALGLLTAVLIAID
jgi:putative membrane protein